MNLPNLSSLSSLAGNFSFNIGAFTVSPAYWQAGLVIFLVFILFLTFAQMRRHFLDWSVKGAVFGIFFGFLLALILEGFLLIGGKTALTEVLGWKNPPKPFSTALELGRNKLVNVLGVSDEISKISASEGPMTHLDSVVNSYQSLTPKDAKQFKALICE